MIQDRITAQQRDNVGGHPPHSRFARGRVPFRRTPLPIRRTPPFRPPADCSPTRPDRRQQPLVRLSIAHRLPTVRSAWQDRACPHTEHRPRGSAARAR
ncbi:hypothetical protein STRIP9103_03134 [Streptomyces ipomoeae 91-03]|uniref:Uncharacterized protein n=1 Tax=Streptomyces ipomoeae 91-03 TaxID=698759 RepID=L1KI80_9ACTN|nr:hypothetical protein STRIP9103_03134 [Streptomyces ipomoeae 91-03]